MQVKFVAPGLNLSERQKDYVESKIQRLKKYANRIADESSLAKVELKEQRLRTSGRVILCEVTMNVPRAVIRAEVQASKLEEAIDIAVEKLKKQIDRYKGRLLRRRDKKGLYVPSMEMPELPDFSQDFPDVPKIVKRKEFSRITPMHEEEAIERMELIGHNFFLFLNRETGRYSVVYRRKEGTYGLIEPKIKTEKN